MEINTLSDYLAIFRRRKHKFIIVSLFIFIVSVGLAFGLPPVYRSNATILVDQQEIPTDLVQSTISSYADERIQRISKRVMTNNNLDDVIKRYNLYAEERQTEGLNAARRLLTKAIKLDLVSAEEIKLRSEGEKEAIIAFRVSYDNQSPELAYEVTKELVSLYLEENRASRLEAAMEAADFLDNEAQEVRARIAEVEDRMAQFKKQHIGQLPEQVDLNLNLIERTERQLLQTQQEIRDLEERKIYLQSELAQIDPYNAVYSLDGEQVLSPVQRLKGLRVRYASLSGIYSSDHPDLVRMRREIQALERELGMPEDPASLAKQVRSAREQLATARERYSDAHPDVKRLQRVVVQLEAQWQQATAGGRGTTQPASKPDNPAYIQLKANLEASRAELASLKRAESELKKKLTVYEQRLTNIPQVEREYRALTREHESLLEEYDEIKDKQRTAELAESLEEGQKGERFVVLSEPQLPEDPARPNRLAILFLGVMVSFAGGVGSAAMAEAMDNAVWGRKGLTNLLNAPPLAVIPYIETTQDIRHKRWRQVLVTMGVLAAILLVAGFVHWQLKLLDDQDPQQDQVSQAVPFFQNANQPPTNANTATALPHVGLH